MFNSKKIAFLASSALSVLATVIVSPYSAGWVHQPEIPKELLKK
ncbi:cyclic lactone autoinducer peptide [Brevibacillus sp. NRS-1366]